MSDRNKDPITETLPQVEIGEVVYWYPDGRTNGTPQAAFVTGIGLGGQTLNLNVLNPTSYNFQIRDGVRHVKDPRTKPSEIFENGAWDLHPQRKRADALGAKVAQLMSLVEPAEPRKKG